MQRFNFFDNMGNVVNRHSMKPTVVDAPTISTSALNFQTSVKTTTTSKPNVECTTRNELLDDGIVECIVMPSEQNAKHFFPKALNEFRKLLSTKNEELSEKTTMLEELQVVYDCQMDKIKDLELAKETLNETLSSRDAALDKAVKRNAGLCTQLERNVNQILTKLEKGEQVVVKFNEHHLDEMKKMEMLTADFKSLSVRHQQFTADFKRVYDLEIEAKQTMKDEFEIQVKNFNEKINGLENELQIRVQMVAEFHNKIAVLLESLDTSETNLKQLEKDVDVKNNLISEIQEEKNQMEREMQTNLDDVIQAKEDLQLEFQREIQIRDACFKDKIDKFQMEIDVVNGQVKTLDRLHNNLLEERDKLSQQVVDLNADLDYMCVCNEDLVLGLENVHEIQCTLDEMKLELSEKLQKLEEREIENFELKTMKANLLENLNEMTNKSESTKKEHQLSKEEIIELKETITKMEKFNQELDTKHREFQEILRCKSMDVVELQKLLKEVNEENELLNKNKLEDGEILKRELDKKTEEIDELRKMVSLREIELVKRDEQTKKTNDDLIIIKEQLAEQQFEFKDVCRKHEAEIEQMNKNFTFTMEKFKLDGDGHLQKVNLELNETKVQIALLSSQSTEKNAELDKICNEKRTIEMDMNVLMKENNQLKKDLKEMNSRLNTIVAEIRIEKPNSLTKTIASPPVISETILKRTLDKRAITTDKSKRVGFLVSTNSETSGSDCQEIEVIEQPFSKQRKMGPILRRPLQPRIPCYMASNVNTANSNNQQRSLVTTGRKSSNRLAGKFSKTGKKKPLGKKVTSGGESLFDDPFNCNSLLFDD